MSPKTELNDLREALADYSQNEIFFHHEKVSDALRFRALTFPEAALAGYRSRDAEVAELLNALTRLARNVDTDLGPCSLDHHGFCQEHFQEKPCIMEGVRALIAKHSAKQAA